MTAPAVSRETELTAEGALLGYAGAPRESVRRRSLFADQHQPPVPLECVLFFYAAAQKEDGILQRRSFGRSEPSTLQHREAVQSQQRQRQFGDRRRRADGTARGRCEARAQIRPVRGAFRAVRHDVARHLERRQDGLEESCLLGVRLDEGNFRVEHDRERNRRETGAAPDVDVRLLDKPGHREAVQDVPGQFERRLCAGEVEALVGLQYPAGKPREPIPYRRNDAGPFQAPVEFARVFRRGQPASGSLGARRSRCRKIATIATSEGVMPGIRPAIPSVRGLWRVSFSRASRESARIAA